MFTAASIGGVSAGQPISLVYLLKLALVLYAGCAAQASLILTDMDLHYMKGTGKPARD